MHVTYYHTINGEILSEQTGGVRTEYMHDALGSVTGTTDGSGNLQNRYWWAPYGTQIAKTGSADDPDFQWVGTLGYRATGRAHSGTYIRARHYGLEHSGWTSVDGKWPAEASYSYAGCLPSLATDADGQSVYVQRNQVGPLSPSTCGDGCSVNWAFTVMPTQLKLDGWLVQQITNAYSVTCCGSNNSGVPSSGCQGYLGSYYELWKVSGGVTQNPKLTLTSSDCATPLSWVAPSSNICGGCNDMWSFVPHLFCSHGNQTKTGALMFLQGSTDSLPAGFAVDPSSCAGCLPVSFSYAGFNALSAGGAKLVSQWSCCQGTAAQCGSCPADASGCWAHDICEVST